RSAGTPRSRIASASTMNTRPSRRNFPTGSSGWLTCPSTRERPRSESSIARSATSGCAASRSCRRSKAPLDSRAFWDFYAKAANLRIPIFVHPALVPQGYAHAADYDLLRIIAREFDLALAATRLIAAGVLEAFPTLKVIVAHFGGGVAA